MYIIFILSNSFMMSTSRYQATYLIVFNYVWLSIRYGIGWSTSFIVAGYYNIPFLIRYYNLHLVDLSSWIGWLPLFQLLFFCYRIQTGKYLHSTVLRNSEHLFCLYLITAFHMCQTKYYQNIWKYFPTTIFLLVVGIYNPCRY